MKNRIFKIVSFAFLLALVTACEENLKSDPVEIDLKQTATIEGSVSVELDYKVAGLEKAPEGTKLVVSIPLSQLYMGSRISPIGNWTDTVFVDANGHFSISVPTNSNGVNVTITPTDFYSDVTLPYYYSSESAMASFEASTISINGVYVGITKIRNIEYSLSDIDDPMETSTLYGMIVGEFDEKIVGYEALPIGTEITFIGSGNDSGVIWSEVLTYNGTSYKIEVPNDVTIDVYWNFKHDKNIYIGKDSFNEPIYSKVKYKYTDGKSLGTINAESIQDFNVGNGEEFPY